MPISRFAADRAASVVPIFALCLVLLFGAAGAAIDYARANAARTAIQAALDATGLMLAKEAETLTPADLTQRANDYFKATFNGRIAKDVQITSQFASPLPGSYTLKLAATGTVETTLARVLGQTQLDIGTSADIAWGIKKLELALVLDNTGSMAQSGKLAALKSASHNLLTTLEQAAKKPGDIKVAIVPFDTTVNIGTGLAPLGLIDFSVNGIKPDKWTGCVVDRDQSHDALDTTPTIANFHTLLPAVNCGSLASLQPLTGDWAALRSKVDGMNAAGYTNITIGMVWGWHALTPNLPLTEAAAPAPDLDKVIVLLTDGENTRNRWSTRASVIDPRTAAVCANVKAAGIKVYTVRVIDGNAALLQGCATKPDMYYDVQQASQLNAAFGAIAQSLASLRILH